MKNDQFKKVSEFTDSYIKAGDVAGTITLIAEAGIIKHLECKGLMNIEEKQPMHEDALFRIYSMTKPVTSVAAMMLYERGAFELRTPISAFIPEFKDTQVYVSGTATNYKTTRPEREITMGDLLSHTSGMTYDFMYSSVVDEIYRNANISALNPHQSLDEFVKIIASLPLLYSPGTKWSYSVATDIVGRIIEVISGQSLDSFLKKEIFIPLGMVDTDFYVPNEKQKRFTANYIRDDKLTMCDDPETGQFSQPPIAYLGGMGLVSTAQDYLRFCTMLLNQGLVGEKQLLKPETVRLMSTNYLPTDIHTYAYINPGAYIPFGGFGLGFAVKLPGSNISGTIGTFGWTGAAHTSFFIDPKEKLIGIFLTQLFPPGYKLEMIQEFRTAVYDCIK